MKRFKGWKHAVPGCGSATSPAASPHSATHLLGRQAPRLHPGPQLLAMRIRCQLGLAAAATQQVQQAGVDRQAAAAWQRRLPPRLLAASCGLRRLPAGCDHGGHALEMGWQRGEGGVGETGWGLLSRRGVWSVCGPDGMHGNAARLN